MKKTPILLITIILIILPFIYADVMTPTVTYVHFEKDGKPYNNPITFNVLCYGYTYPIGSFVAKEEGTYTPEVVFSFSASCPNYGCKIYEPYYLNYRHIDYCDLEGETNEGKFKIEKYSNSPVNFSECKDIEITMINNIYYKITEEYKKCLNDIYKVGTTFTDSEGKTWKRISSKEWEVTSSNGDKQIIMASDALIADEDHLNCDQYLIEASESELEIDDKGNIATFACELKFEISGKECAKQGESCGGANFINCCEGLICYTGNKEGGLGICIKEDLKNKIKIMPETASIKAIEKLGDLGFNISLKETGKGDNVEIVYELTGEKQGRFLGIFKIMTKVSAQVNAETGEIRVIKPWWSFLVTGI